MFIGKRKFSRIYTESCWLLKPVKCKDALYWACAQKFCFGSRIVPCCVEKAFCQAAGCQVRGGSFQHASCTEPGAQPVFGEEWGLKIIYLLEMENKTKSQKLNVNFPKKAIAWFWNPSTWTWSGKWMMRAPRCISNNIYLTVSAVCFLALVMVFKIHLKI